MKGAESMKMNVKQWLMGAAVTSLLGSGSSILAADKVDFEKQIWPIIERSCLKCHKAPYVDERGRKKKPKAGLRVDTAELFMAGADDEDDGKVKVIIPGKPEKSSFYTLTTLDEDDDDVMPSKGDLLTKEEQDLLKQWILEGAKFGKWKAWDGKSASAAPKRAKSRIEIIAEGVKPVADSALAPARTLGALAMPLAQKHSLVRVDFSRVADKTTDAALDSLVKLSSQLTDLNLAGSKISDGGLKSVAKYSNLTRLHLEKTGITDAGLASLSKLNNLEYLNVYGTKVSDAGLKHLATQRNLKKLYVWQTQVTASGVAAIQKMLPNLEVVAGGNGRAKVSDKLASGFLKDACCAKAHAADTACSRTCCLKASASNTVCKPCNTAKVIPTLTGKKAELAALFVKDGCCGKARSDGKVCEHKCCVGAAEKDEICIKCNKGADAGFKKLKAKWAGGDKAAELKALFVKGSCCAKAGDKACAHKCCVAAAKKNDVCAKCNEGSEAGLKKLKAKWAASEKKPAAKGGDKASELKALFVKGSCCAKAGDKACAHKCCVAAAKKNDVCAKCNEGSEAGLKKLKEKWAKEAKTVKK